MGRAELEQEWNDWWNQGEAHATRECELHELADGVQEQLRAKGDQLERARRARQLCEQAKAAQQAAMCDLETFGSKLAAALDADAVRYSVVSLFEPSSSDADASVRAANQLVSELEKECGELNRVFEDYCAQAQAEGDAASDCWENVRRVESEMANCED